MTPQPKVRMTVEEFIPWAMAQPRGRFELVQGQVVAMAPERVRHNLLKLAAARALERAVEKAGLPCTVFTDGMTVRIDAHTAREPDASVQCGVALDLDSLELEAPLIVVEVTSPSSELADTSTKLVEYFSVPSIRHYLIVDSKNGAVIHHARGPGNAVDTLILTAGTITLDPPGLVLTAESLLHLPTGPSTDDAG
ncbi:MAG: Uma2 family endonuclease [Pseudomonadota bacterium]